MEKGISQREMSTELGKHPNYISRIEARRAFPSMETFFQICEYFETTPHVFFADDIKKPALLQRALDELEALGEEDLMLIFLCIKRIGDK